jgi:predicted AlkP superfamily pyrophosphatase or phosphodiesterase
MDDTGHRYGPNNDDELKKTLFRLDHELGSLFEGLKSFDLPIHVVLVSDHGMAEVKKENLILLEPLTEGIQARVVNNGALAHLHLSDPSEKAAVVALLRKREPNITVDDLSSTVNYSDLAAFPQRLGDLLILPNEGYYLADARGSMRYQNSAARFKTEVFGEHGFSPAYQDMWGIFYANGPQIQKGLTLAPFQNIHIYPLLCRLLGLPIPSTIDGKEAVLAPLLK